MYIITSKEDNMIFVKQDLLNPDPIQVEDVEVDIDLLIKEKEEIEARAKEIDSIIIEKTNLVSTLDKEPVKKIPVDFRLEEEPQKDDN